MNRIIIPGLLQLIVLIVVSSCASHTEEHEAETKFLVTSPVIKDTIITQEYVSQIRSIQHIELRALEKGYLQNIYVDEGQFVKKGQKMFQIMPLLYQAELQKAAAEANFAEIEYKNTKALADSNIVSENELALAKANYDKAKAALSLAEVHLGFTEIKAPFDGIMDRFHVRLGSLVDEGDLLTTLSDNSMMWVYFNVPEAEYLEYITHNKSDSLQIVELEMANGKLFDQKGIVETIGADFNNETGNIPFRATFSNPNGILRHGETGNVLVQTPLNNAILIPQKATFEVLDKKYVFVVNEENQIESRQIKTGEELPHIYEVVEGLDTDDKILLEGLRLVRENDHISYNFLNPDSVIAALELYAE
jgi:membrane fusion protein (multidrug efflux system)